MRLKNYLFANQMPINHMAKKVGVHPGYLSKILNERLIPSMKLCKKIEEATEGKVTTLELLQLADYEPILMH